MVSIITDVYDMKHEENKVKDIIFNQVLALAEAVSDDDNFRKLKVKIGIVKCKKPEEDYC